MSSRYKDKGRIPGQYTAIRWEIFALRRMEADEHGGATALYRAHQVPEL